MKCGRNESEKNYDGFEVEGKGWKIKNENDPINSLGSDWRHSTEFAFSFWPISMPCAKSILLFEKLVNPPASSCVHLLLHPSLIKLDGDSSDLYEHGPHCS